MIEARAIIKRYRNKTLALDKVSFTLDKKITSIIGRNGAGKTTLLRILSTQLMPSSGTALINDYDVVKEANKIRNIAVSIPQEAKPITFLSASNCVRLYLAARGMDNKKARAKADKAIKRVGLWKAREMPSDELSGGMKRKIFVAMALASDADVIFLDEPTTGLDPFSRIEIWSAIKAIKGQVVLTTHYMEEAQALSDEVLMMDKGRILAQGTVSELLKQFTGLIRVESPRKMPLAYKVGNTWVSYVKKSKAQSFISEGDIIKPITLDDLFIKRGVNLEY
jgi:ABC-2 type transport system ATP-binding protein